MKLCDLFAGALLSIVPLAPFGNVAHATETDPVGDSPTRDTAGAPETLDLRDEVRTLEERVRQTDQMILARQPRLTISAYADIGFFAPMGNRGVGVIQDVGSAEMRAFPEKAAKFGWVFLGDPLATAVNTRGEAADLGNLPGVDRYDSIHSGGASSFLANELNLTLRAAVAESALATASVNFAPRSGNDFHPGDGFDVDQMQIEWMPGLERRTSIFVGKFDSILGIEYRERKSTQRFGITPSLLARYTMGTPIGIKIRSKLGTSARPDMVILAAALTNGSFGTETFHFHDEIDSNSGKTATGRLSVSPSLPFRMELGLSGEYGPQDHAQNSQKPLWFVGVDLQARVGALELKAQWLRGGAEGERSLRGEGVHRVYGLRLDDAGYLELNLTPHARWGFLLRGEFRDATVWLGDPNTLAGADRIYIASVWRSTVGARFAFTDRVIFKAEFLHNGEYGSLPSFKNDILTSSLVLIY